MDEEKQFCFDGDNMPGSAWYYINVKEKCPEDVFFYGNHKFPKNIQVDSQIKLRHVEVTFCEVIRLMFLETNWGYLTQKVRTKNLFASFSRN